MFQRCGTSLQIGMKTLNTAGGSIVFQLVVNGTAGAGLAVTGTTGTTLPWETFDLTSLVAGSGLTVADLNTGGLGTFGVRWTPSVSS